MRSSSICIEKVLRNHAHSESFVVPFRANAPTVTAGAGAWDDTGVLVELIPAGSIAEPFDLHWADVVCGNNAQYQIGLYAGPPGSEVRITEFPTERVGVQTATVQMGIMAKVQPAGTRISARISSNVPGATLTIKLAYHVH